MVQKDGNRQHNKAIMLGNQRDKHVNMNKSHGEAEANNGPNKHKLRRKVAPFDQNKIIKDLLGSD